MGFVACAQPEQLLAIAQEGWRLRVDTQTLCVQVTGRQPWQLSEAEADEFLWMMIEETSPYNWETEDDGQA